MQTKLEQQMKHRMTKWTPQNTHRADVFSACTVTLLCNNMVKCCTMPMPMATSRSLREHAGSQSQLTRYSKIFSMARLGYQLSSLLLPKLNRSDSDWLVGVQKLGLNLNFFLQINQPYSSIQYLRYFSFSINHL